jgi:hypothetical protein
MSSFNVSKFQDRTHTAQLDFLVEGLPLAELDTHAIYGKISSFLIFCLVVAMASKVKSST